VSAWTVVACLALLRSAPTRATSPPITALAFAPDGLSVVVGSQAGLEVRSWPALQKKRLLPSKLSHVLDLAFSPDGKTLAANGGAPAKRGSVEFFSWPEGKLLRRSNPHRDLIHAVSWRGDSRLVVTASADSTVKFLEMASGKEVRVFEGHSRGVCAAVFLPGGALLTAGLDHSLRLWDAGTGKLLRTLQNHTRPVLGLAVRPGAAKPPLVASVGEDRTLRLWQPTVGRLVRFVRLKSVPLAVAWASDGRALVVACKDGHLRVIDPDTVEVVQDLSAIDGVAYCLAVARDGTVLVGGQRGQLAQVRVKPITP
jgi:WD40 repeat protein